MVLPDEPAPVRLMNTIWADRSGVHDELRSCRGARIALVAAGLLDPGVPVSAQDRRAVQELRDALRRLAEVSTNDVRPRAASPLDVHQALHVVNNAAATHPPIAALEFRDAHLAPVAGGPGLSVNAALGWAATQAIELIANPGRLKACNAPGCVLFFVQHHPRREWCSTACGNRARAARHYRRHHPPVKPGAR